jgi:hypothetical protein
MDVKSSNGLWARWMEFRSKLPRLVLLTLDLNSPADGFEIHLAPSLMITPASSEADSETESSRTSSTAASEDLPTLKPDSAETSESSDDQEGMRTGAIAVAQINVGGMTAMPNVRGKYVSISARNHEPDSFSQFLDNHKRRPVVEEVPHPKLLVKAMEHQSSLEAYVEVPMAVLMDELEEGGVISHLWDRRATVKLSPTTSQQITELPEPRTLSVI